MSIKQNGGVFGRNPTFNDVTIEGQLTFDGDIDINSDLKVDGDLDVTGTAIVDKLGINAPTPASALDVVGANKDAIRIRSTVASNQYYQVGRNQSTGLLELKGSEATYNGYLFKGPSSDLMEITAAGNVSVSTGNLVIGTSGKGIDFSATAGTGTSELLDDYEEGTWTPVLADASAGGNVATGTFAGTYVKIGKQVTLNCTLTNITTSGMTGGNNLYIRGLPFSTGVGHLGSLMAREVTYSGEIAPRTLDGQSYFYLYQYSSGGAVTVLTVSGIASGTADLWITVTYEA
tara:strand:- start:1487 stop:2353 length:867 start_codon:yes stop_codon:yes gene_type:complete